MNNHVCGGRHSMRALSNWFHFTNSRWCLFRCIILLWMGCIHQAKGFNFEKKLERHYWRVSLSKRSWIWILMKIFHYLPLLHAHSTTNKVSQSISSTLLAHTWLSSYTHWTATFSLGICAGWSHNAMLSQQVPQDLILGLPVFHLSNTDNTVVMY